MMKLFDFHSTQLDSRLRGNDGIYCNIVTKCFNFANKEIKTPQQKIIYLKQEDSVIRKFRMAAADGINYHTSHYNFKATSPTIPCGKSRWGSCHWGGTFVGIMAHWTQPVKFTDIPAGLV